MESDSRLLHLEKVYKHTVADVKKFLEGFPTYGNNLNKKTV
jgi:hypothetical protein